ncbi:MAG: hypothetical protein EOP18_12570 [Rhizobiaceae bacterium]|nr:MAG: hypothetical protein EOP18_12570 [Rhizobiaceae bacterium]
MTWAGSTLAHLFGSSLADPRVTVLMRDVHDVIVDNAAEFDAIVLDVDNGPDGLVSLANERLYCNWGLRAAHTALRPGGLLAVWSAHPDDDFFSRIEDAGFAVEEVEVDSSEEAGRQPHVIWLAVKVG